VIKMSDNGIAAVFGSGMVEDCPLWVIQSPTATMECNRDGRRSLMAFVGLEEVPEIDGFQPVKTTLIGSAELAVQMGLRQITRSVIAEFRDDQQRSCWDDDRPGSVIGGVNASYYLSDFSIAIVAVGISVNRASNSSSVSGSNSITQDPHRLRLSRRRLSRHPPIHQHDASEDYA
jgi:hypothetical protein